MEFTSSDENLAEKYAGYRARASAMKQMEASDLNRTYPWPRARPSAIIEGPRHQPSVSDVLVWETEIVVYGGVQVLGDAIYVNHRVLPNMFLVTNREIVHRGRVSGEEIT